MLAHLESLSSSCSLSLSLQVLYMYCNSSHSYVGPYRMSQNRPPSKESKLSNFIVVIYVTVHEKTNHSRCVNNKVTWILLHSCNNHVARFAWRERTMPNPVQVEISLRVAILSTLSFSAKDSYCSYASPTSRLWPHLTHLIVAPSCVVGLLHLLVWIIYIDIPLKLAVYDYNPLLRNKFRTFTNTPITITGAVTRAKLQLIRVAHWHS